MMKLSVYFKWLSMAAICLCAYSCQMMMEEEVEDGETVLKVDTRSTEDGNISYPLFLYAFNEDGENVVTQIVEDGEHPLEILLPTGCYQVVALSGNSDSYDIPESPSLNDCVEMDADGGADIPLMMGMATVEIEGKGDEEVELVLSYVVAAVNVIVKDIPSDISSLSFSVSPLYSSIFMTGEYGGESITLKTSCSLVEEGIWKSDTLYVFPGNEENVVFSILLERKDGSKDVYKYTCAGRPEAGHIFNVNGKYAGGVTVGGNVVGGKWEGVLDVEFEFGNMDNGGSVDVFSEIPEMGTIWNGAIVADVCVDNPDDDSTGADILLLSLEEWDVFSSQVEEVAENYSVNGMTGWRLPTYDEAKTLRYNYNGEKRVELNQLIAEYDEELYGIDGEERYLCDKDGVFYSFVFSTGKAISQAGTQRSYYVRLVKSCRAEPE